MKEIIIPRDEAVFWMDENGRWHNQHGPFQHHKIVDYFHASISRDQDGYYLTQEYDNIREKVYFPYAETPLFVFDVIRRDAITLVLNTKKQIPLDPEKLYVKNDRLFMRFGEESIKFTEQALMKLSDCILEEDGQTVFRINDQHYPIHQDPSL